MIRELSREISRGVAHAVGGWSNYRYPAGAILHWDANDGLQEKAGFGHDFQSLVLGNQYKLQADGSVVNIGATMPVDTINGEKWLRSCGAVTNLLPSGAQDLVVASWTKRGTAQVAAFADGSNLITGVNLTNNDVYCQIVTTVSVPVTPVISIKKVSASGVLLLLNPGAAANGQWEINLSLLGEGFEAIHSTHPAVTVVVPHVSTGTGQAGLHFRAKSDGPLSFYVRNPQLTATAYPQPYTPPGTTMPATNATTTNGAWFTLRDGSELWKALTGQPLTLATRVRMGVGSGDLPNGATGQIIRANESGTQQQFLEVSGAGESRIVRAYDGTSYLVTISTWPRNAIIRRVTQVNTSGKQFRVGYAIEGTHTSFQWSSWANFDGSFGPSTLYRLMLGYNNAYPMWFSRITAWRKQVSDAEIMEALS